MIKIYVLYSEYGLYEGCSEPRDVVLTEEAAKEWVEKNPNSNDYVEFSIDVPAPVN